MGRSFELVRSDLSRAERAVVVLTSVVVDLERFMSRSSISASLLLVRRQRELGCGLCRDVVVSISAVANSTPIWQPRRIRETPER